MWRDYHDGTTVLSVMCCGILCNAVTVHCVICIFSAFSFCWFLLSRCYHNVVNKDDYYHNWLTYCYWSQIFRGHLKITATRIILFLDIVCHLYCLSSTLQTVFNFYHRVCFGMHLAPSWLTTAFSSRIM